MMKRKIGLFMLSVLLLAPFALFSAAKAFAQSSFTSNASITFVPGEGTPRCSIRQTRHNLLNQA